MRRKSQRNTSNKSQNSPEKKVETDTKKRRSRRRKQSTSSENDSVEEAIPLRQAEVLDTLVQPPKTPVKEDSPEETPEQVWQVRTSESSHDTGEIQKLKICLKRPPSTPERTDRSPRSKRKHTRTTSSSDTPSVEGEERKKKHKTRRPTRESREEVPNSENSQEESEKNPQEVHEDSTVSQSTEPVIKEKISVELTSSTAEETISQSKKPDDKTNNEHKNIDSQTNEDQVDSTEKVIEEVSSDKNIADNNEVVIELDDESMETSETNPKLHEESLDIKDSKQPKNEEDKEGDHEEKGEPSKDKVSIREQNDCPKKIASSISEVADDLNKTDVVEHESKNSRRSRKSCDESSTKVNDSDKEKNQELQQSDGHNSTQEENKTNGPIQPIIINRKRRWGKGKLNSQSSITISTDVLKEIIPDVKPTELEEVIDEKKKHKRIEMERPVLPKIIINNTDHVEQRPDTDELRHLKKESATMSNRRISVVRDDDVVISQPSPPRHEPSCILYITNLVRPFTLPQLKNLLQRTGRIAEDGFWIDKIKSRCFVQYENEDQAVETRHALHGVTWPVSNPKTLQVDFSSREMFEKAKSNEEAENTHTSNIPSTVEDWLKEQDAKRDRGEADKPWEKKSTREWDVGKGEKERDEKITRHRDGERPIDRRHRRSLELSPEPARKFKKKEEEAPAKLLDDLFRKTKTTPCIYWLPLSAETIAVKEEQRRQQLLEHERRIAEMRRRRH